MIRGATTADYPTYATLFRELGVDDPTPSRDRWTSELARDTLISEREGRVDGYVTYLALSEAGHVRNLVVAPKARSTGVGRALMEAAAASLRSRGIGEWHLNVRVGNAPAIALYEKLGMAVEHRSTVLRVPIDRTRELPRAEAMALPVLPEEDDDIERSLGLLAGRIAMLRKKARQLVQLRDATCAAVGFAAFDPAIPGAMPFRVARPELAGTLLDALVTPNPWIQIVVEDDRELRTLLLGVDAEIKLELLHYKGVI